MTNNEIVEEIVKTGVLDDIIKRITNGDNDPDLKDLRQDILISLLQDTKLPGIYERRQIKFYISRIVLNNIASSTSPYYRIYKRPRLMNDGITPKILNLADGQLP